MVMPMYEMYFRNRLLSLINNRNLSEYQLSLDLGHCQGYIHSITSGRNLPSMSAFFDICTYFELTPSEFFDANLHDPALTHKILENVKSLNDEDQLLLLTVLNRIVSNKKNLYRGFIYLLINKKLSPLIVKYIPQHNIPEFHFNLPSHQHYIRISQ